MSPNCRYISGLGRASSIRFSLRRSERTAGGREGRSAVLSAFGRRFGRPGVAKRLRGVATPLRDKRELSAARSAAGEVAP
jgi:hypothetical protein